MTNDLNQNKIQMLHTARIFIFNFGIIIFTSCNSQGVKFSKDDQNDKQIKKIVLNSKDIKEEFDIAHIIDDFYYVHLALVDNNLIGQVDKVLRHDDRIYVMDRVKSKGVFCFDISGQYLFRVGTLGGGPGEYKEIKDMVLDTMKNEIGILSRNKLSWYRIQNGSYTGSLTKFKKFIIDRVAMLDSTTLIGYANNQCGSKNYCANFYLLTKDGNIKDQFLPIQDFEKDLYIEYENPFSGGTYSNSYTHLFNDTIYIINNENKFVADYVVDFGDMAIKDRTQLPSKTKEIGSWIDKSIINNEVVGFEFYYQNKEIINFMFRKGKSLISAFYFKNTNELIAAHSFKSTDILFTENIVGVFNNQLISVLDGSQLIGLQESLIKANEKDKNEVKKIIGQQHYDYIMSLDAMANPTIVFATLKENL